MNISRMKVFIGHDPREQEAYDVCEFSIKTRSALSVEPLVSSKIPEYLRPREPHQSTDFTYTRFFVPHLMKHEGWALFCDCDFLFLKSPAEILLDNPHLKDYPVSVVKHPQYIPRSEMKMDDIPQNSMWRKNWASLILFNCNHPSNKVLTPEYVNTTFGRNLHQFSWLEDDEIGSIPMNWNVLDDYYLIDDPAAIHYTDGGPWFEKYQDTTYSNLWKIEKLNYDRSKASINTTVVDYNT